MAGPWFLLTPLPAEGEVVALDPAEARHARGAQRLREGDAVVLFDGRGETAEARIVRAARAGVRVQITARARRARPAPALHVASALPKGERQSQLLGMATQLGMSSFTPLACARSVVRPEQGRRERWERILTEACKQSRRAWRPVLLEPEAPAALARARAGDGPVLLLDAAGATPDTILADRAVRGASELWLIVGPEGGLDDEERHACLAAGAQPLAVSDAILRIETAVAAGLALLGQLRLHEPSAERPRSGRGA